MSADEAGDYFARQSALTDPGQYHTLYDALPRDIPALARVVQGLIIQPHFVRFYGLATSDVETLGAGFGVRPIAELLARLQQRDARPLSEPRPPRLRLAANCRNFGTLLVSMLRHQGIPARLRVGFAGYFPNPMYFDHRITEYWDRRQGRWVLADPMIDDVVREARGITCNTMDLRPNDPFRLSADVWQRCRAGVWNPNGFGDSETDRGMAPIRYALLHDFAALNKRELLGCDDWGELITQPEGDLTDGDLALLDEMAGQMADVDANLRRLQSLFATTAYGRAVIGQLSAAA